MSDQDLENRLLAARLATATKAAKPASQPPQPDASGRVTLDDGTVFVVNPATGQYTNAEMLANNMQPGAGGAALAGATNAATLGWGDELLGMLGGPIMTERARAQDIAAYRDNPKTYIGGALAGGLAAAAPIAKGASLLPLVGKLASGSLVAQSGGAALLGGAMGAVQGAGDANGGDRTRGAAIGAGIGGAIGAVSPALGSVVQKGAQWTMDRLRSLDITGISRALKISPDAAKVIKGALDGDDVVAAQAAIDKAGAGAMLADSSPQASQLLDTTVQAGGPAMRIAREAVDTRSQAASAGLKSAMDTTLGVPEGIKGAAQGIAAKTAASRKAAYDAAYGSAINYATPEGAAIEAVIARVPNSTMKSAIQEANDAMKAAGIKNAQIMATIAPDGAVSFKEMPNVEQLDFLKRALGAVAEGEKDQFGRLTAAGVRASKLATELKDAISGAVPSYRTAVRLGGDKIAEDKALELGSKFMQPGLTREAVATAMKGASAETRLAAKKGMRTALDEAMANVKAVASDLDVDVRQAVNAIKQFSSEANRVKAELILGKTAAKSLFDEFDKAATQLALRTAIARNSATASRTAGKEAMDDVIMGGPMNALKRGKLGDWGRGLVQMMTKTTPADDLAKRQAVYAEVAKALTGITGQDAKRALTAMQAAMTGAPIAAAQANLIAKVLSRAVTIGGYQETQRTLSTSASGPR